jgi:hypothetical protein
MVCSADNAAAHAVYLDEALMPTAQLRTTPSQTCVDTATHGHFRALSLKELRREMDTAANAERAIWKKLEMRAPGTPGYNEELWQEWRDAVRLLEAVTLKVLITRRKKKTGSEVPTSALPTPSQS